MAILRPPLLPLGLLLCLWLLCSLASCTNPAVECKPITSVTNKLPSYIDVYPWDYESNKLYTVSLIVEPNITSVILEARDQHDSVVGSWQNPSISCEGRAEYNLKGQIRTLFEAKWMSPKSTDICSVTIYVYCANLLRHAELAPLTLSRVGAPSGENAKHFPVRSITPPGHRPTAAPRRTTPAPRRTTPAPQRTTPAPPKPTISHPTPTTPHPTPTTPHPTPTTPHPTPTTPHPTPTTSHPKPTTSHPKPTTSHPKPTTTNHKHTTRNSANRAFLSPVREAIQILLIFLTSTLLF
ncbi:placenta-expressed transcript 1 protein [Odocoileus virginianus]|uniref:Placenta-expressed transcript 1 protein n=1 Tax=Odocoileus virginianus TaxID=9874 RepID=A0A6J0WJH9_ODOVR